MTRAGSSASTTLAVNEGDGVTRVSVSRSADGTVTYDPDAQRTQFGILLAMDIGDDVDECEDLLDDLRAVHARERAPFQRGWDMTMLRIDADACTLRAGYATAEPTEVTIPTAQLISALEQLREFLRVGRD